MVAIPTNEIVGAIMLGIYIAVALVAAGFIAQYLPAIPYVSGHKYLFAALLLFVLGILLKKKVFFEITFVLIAIEVALWVEGKISGIVQ